MNDIQHTYVEIIAPSVEEAIEKGLQDLNLPREAVDVEILDKGRRGLLGVVGNRQVRVRLIVKKEEEKRNDKKPEELITPPAAFPTTYAAREGGSVADLDESHPEDEDEDTAEIARTALVKLLENMNIRAEVSSTYVEKPSDPDWEEGNAGPRRIVSLNITGQDLSILIGRQAETLHAIQFITSLMVNKKAGKAVPLTVDVEGYRERRRRQLLQMAQRMAEQAMRTGRRQVLEPMSSEDRRTIHLELRNHPDVFTESVGDEPRRKVTIVPR